MYLFWLLTFSWTFFLLHTVQFFLNKFFCSFSLLEWHRRTFVFFVFFTSFATLCIKNCKSRMPCDIRWKRFSACLIILHSSFSFLSSLSAVLSSFLRITSHPFLSRKKKTLRYYGTNNVGKSCLSCFFIPHAQRICKIMSSLLFSDT